jgi:hypothetical protein
MSDRKREKDKIFLQEDGKIRKVFDYSLQGVKTPCSLFYKGLKPLVLCCVRHPEFISGSCFYFGRNSFSFKIDKYSKIEYIANIRC